LPLDKGSDMKFSNTEASHTNLYQFIPKFTNLYQNLPKFTKIYQSFRVDDYLEKSKNLVY